MEAPGMLLNNATNSTKDGENTACTCDVQKKKSRIEDRRAVSRRTHKNKKCRKGGQSCTFNTQRVVVFAEPMYGVVTVASESKVQREIKGRALFA